MTRKYSHFFQTLHDEAGPVGSFGSGAHYSVLRATVFHDHDANPLSDAKFFDFAVVWDEDHDERVIQPIERLYRSGDLPSFTMLGERKGMLFGLLSPSLQPRPLHIARIAKAETSLETSCVDVGGDDWSSRVVYEGRPDGMIYDADEKVRLYINTINMLWSLGLKQIIEPARPELLDQI